MKLNRSRDEQHKWWRVWEISERPFTHSFGYPLHLNTIFSTYPPEDPALPTPWPPPNKATTEWMKRRGSKSPYILWCTNDKWQKCTMHSQSWNCLRPQNQCKCKFLIYALQMRNLRLHCLVDASNFTAGIAWYLFTWNNTVKPFFERPIALTIMMV